MSNKKPMVAGVPASARLMAALDYRLAPPVDALDVHQVAVVLHALADHTALEAAVRHSPDDSAATSVGRWLHAVADDLDGVWR